MANGPLTNFEWKKNDYVVSEGIDTDEQIITIIQGTARKTGSPDKNYIRTNTYTMANDLNARVGIDYFDGLGRPVQNIIRSIDLLSDYIKY